MAKIFLGNFLAAILLSSVVTTAFSMGSVNLFNVTEASTTTLPPSGTGTGDTTSPKVACINPAKGTTGVPVSSAITAMFSEPVQRSTVNPTTFTLKDSNGKAIPGKVDMMMTQSGPGIIATFKPSSPLSADKTFTAKITDGVKDMAGNAVFGTQWSFSTGSSTTLPSSPITIVSVYPDDATAFIPPVYIAVKFSQPVQTSTVTSSTFTLKDSSGNPIQGTVVDKILSDSVPNPQFAYFKPSSPLEDGKTYTAKLNGIKDLSGQSLTPYEWSFTTLKRGAYFPPVFQGDELKFIIFLRENWETLDLVIKKRIEMGMLPKMTDLYFKLALYKTTLKSSGWLYLCNYVSGYPYVGPIDCSVHEEHSSGGEATIAPAVFFATPQGQIVLGIIGSVIYDAIKSDTVTKSIPTGCIVEATSQEELNKCFE